LSLTVFLSQADAAEVAREVKADEAISTAEDKQHDRIHLPRPKLAKNEKRKSPV
jgi:hypothetical protein